jgi:hypothetical protein
MNTLLLPQPKQLSRLDGSFALTLDTLVLIPTQADDETFFAAVQLQNETVEATLYSPSIVKAIAPPREETIIMLICGAEQAASFGIEPINVAYLARQINLVKPSHHRRMEVVRAALRC